MEGLQKQSGAWTCESGSVGVEGLECRVELPEERDACEVEEGGVCVWKEAEGETGHDEGVEGVVACFDCCS